MKRELLLITAIVFTILSANAQLPINQDFESGSLTSGGWTHVTVTGTMNWVIDDIHGIDGSKCGKVTGYTGVSGVYEINESWYVSPAINADAYSSIFLNFYSALGYTGDAMTAWYSSDYTGNPSTATWTEITGINWATNDTYWVWTPSGTINLSAMTGTSVYIAFKYVNSTTTRSNTWELDNIHIGETSGISQIVNTLSIYPNPVKTELNINSASKIASVTVSNLIGQTVMNVNNVNNSTYKFNVKGLANGVYLLNINNIDGARSVSKFIKE